MGRIAARSAAFRWTGEVMEPLPTFEALCDRIFVVGQTYVLDDRQERSGVTHRHYFAAIREAWATKHESFDLEYPSPEHLRKKALIHAGYATPSQIACGSPEEAQRVAAFARGLDDYAVVFLRDAVVTVYTARSQDYRSMDGREFQASKEAVLNRIEHLLDVPPGELEANAETSA